MPEDVTNTEATENPKQEKLDTDAEYITGEGMSIAAFVQQQREENAKKREEAAKEAEEKTADDKSQESAQEQSAEDKTADTKSKESETKEEAGEKTAQEKSQEPVEIGKLSDEELEKFLAGAPIEIKTWRKAYEDREKWNTALKTRAQTLPFLEKITPEQWDILAPKLLPYVHGKESIPETPEKFLEETLEGLNGEIPENIRVEFYDEDMEQDREMTIDKKHYLPVIKKVAGQLIKNALPELPVLRERQRVMQEENENLKSQNDNLVKAQGYLILKGFFQGRPDLAPTTLNDKETPVDALFRIAESGEEHPEFGKWLKTQSAAKLSEERNILFEDAWDILYGANERKIKREEENKEKILQNQKKEPGEKGGEEAQPDPLEKQKRRLPQSYQDVVEEMFNTK